MDHSIFFCHDPIDTRCSRRILFAGTPAGHRCSIFCFIFCFCFIFLNRYLFGTDIDHFAREVKHCENDPG